MKRKHLASSVTAAIVSCIASLSSGCASIVSKSHYNIALYTNKPATVEISDRSGAVVCKTMSPGNVLIPAKYCFFYPNKYTFKFNREGYPEVQKQISAGLDIWWFGNVLFGFGGIVGAFVVDPATGAMWELDECSLGVHYEDTTAATGNMPIDIQGAKK